MGSIIHRCFIYSSEQEKLLRSKKYKIDRMECFMTLADRVVRVPTPVDISDHRQIVLTKGQFIASDVELSRQWDRDRKTVAKLMNEMERMGIFTSTKVAEVTVYCLHSLSGWYVDGTFDMNPFYRKPGRPSDPVMKPVIPEIKVITKPENKTDPLNKVAAEVATSGEVLSPQSADGSVPVDANPGTNQTSAPNGGKV